MKTGNQYPGNKSVEFIQISRVQFTEIFNKNSLEKGLKKGGK